MSLDRLELNHFSAFQKLNLDFSPGINVLIGGNGTGKSHVLKILYVAEKSCRSAVQEWNGRHEPNQEFQAMFRQKLNAVFRPEEGAVGRLVHRRQGRTKGSGRINWSDGTINFLLRTDNHLSASWDQLPSAGPAVFFPSREVMSFYEGFIGAYQNRELSFDETYYDLCLALNAKPLRGPRLAGAKGLLEPLEQAIRGKVELTNGRFYLNIPGEGIFEAHLVAEGWRKLATLAYLIANGTLQKSTVLFWDEPEANLNPRLVTVVRRVLMTLASNGVQIFLATHDYLLTNELSLQAEYETLEASTAKLRFILLNRKGPLKPIEATYGGTLSDIKDNPILDEFAAHYERERALFESQSNEAAGNQ